MNPLANERIKELTAVVKETVNQHSMSSASCSIGCSKNVILLNSHFIWHYLAKYFEITRAAIYNLFNKYTIIGYQLLKFKDKFFFLPAQHNHFPPRQAFLQTVDALTYYMKHNMVESPEITHLWRRLSSTRHEAPRERATSSGFRRAHPKGEPK